jgi:nucleoid-associated protein YgaU
MSVFTIEELERTAAGDLAPTGVKFEWDAKTQTSPEGEWQYGLSLLTVRDENPGNDRPTEQILAPRFDDFTMSGRWDDRYAGAGFAERTRREMEAFVGRSGLARLSIDAISVVGIVKNLVIRYRHRALIRYAFTVSAHYRDDGLVRSAVESLTAAVGMPAATAPDTFVDRAQAEVETAVAVHQDYPVGPSARVDDVQAVGTSVRGWQDSLSEMRDIIDARLLDAEDQVGAASRLAATFGALKTEAFDVLARLRGITSTGELAFESAIAVLDFEVWSRGLRGSALRLVMRSEEARRELGRRDRPRAVATHRAKRGESLYAISNLYYGTPFRWLAIYERNDLSTTELAGGELLIIPEGA